MYVVWEDNNQSGRQLDIFFAVSNDNGQTFSLQQKTSVTILEVQNFHKSQQGNNVYVAWLDDTPGTRISFLQ